MHKLKNDVILYAVESSMGICTFSNDFKLLDNALGLLGSFKTADWKNTLHKRNNCETRVHMKINTKKDQA